MWFLYFIKDLVAVPAILVGIFTLIGALIQKKGFSKTIVSVFKVIIGFLIMGGGAGVLVGSLNKFQPVFQATYGLSGVIPNNDGLAGAMVGALPSIVSLASIIMILGMIMNLILAAFSRFKYVYLSGHVLYYMSISLALIMYTSGMDFENNSGDYAVAIMSGAAIMGVYMVISPAIQQRYMKQIIGNNEIALGHTGGFGYAFSGFIGEMVSKYSKKTPLSTEEIKFPKSLYFFRNTLVSISITVMIFYMFAFIPGGIMFELGKPKFVEGTEAYAVLDSPNWLVTMLVSAFTFTAGIEIILVGVRLFVGELVPMFKGISDKIIKNAKAAVDCPVVFPYAPNAVLVGFIASFAGGLIGMAITIGLSASGALAAVILPGLVPHFFLGATGGVFGNIQGGIKGAIIGPFLIGIFITFVPAFFIWGGWVPISSSSLEELAKSTGESSEAIEALNWGDTDYAFGNIYGLFGKISKWFLFPMALLSYLVLLVDGLIARKRKTGPYSIEQKINKS